MKLLFIGEAPSRLIPGSEPGLFNAGSGLRVATWAGCTPAAFRKTARWTNLFHLPVERWNALAARLRAFEIVTGPARRQLEASRVILLGVRVRDAFAFSAATPAFTWTAGAVAWMPHPSGRNRYWNDPAHVRRVRRFLRAAIDGGAGLPKGTP